MKKSPRPRRSHFRQIAACVAIAAVVVAFVLLVFRGERSDKRPEKGAKVEPGAKNDRYLYSIPHEAPADYHPVLAAETGFTDREAAYLNDALFLLEKVLGPKKDPHLDLISKVKFRPHRDGATREFAQEKGSEAVGTFAIYSAEKNSIEIDTKRLTRFGPGYFLLVVSLAHELDHALHDRVAPKGIKAYAISEERAHGYSVETAERVMEYLRTEHAASPSLDHWTKRLEVLSTSDRAVTRFYQVHRQIQEYADVFDRFRMSVPKGTITPEDFLKLAAALSDLVAFHRVPTPVPELNFRAEAALVETRKVLETYGEPAQDALDLVNSMHEAIREHIALSAEITDSGKLFR